MTTKNPPLYAKILLSVFSLIFFLAILEAGLWVVGKMYYEHDEVYRTDENPDLNINAGGQTTDIIAVGDSFTHGGMVKGNETYTSHLRELLSQKQVNDVRVINKGICELNTHELVQRFPDMISKRQPKVVLLLVGATNRFNPWAYEAYKNNNRFSAWIVNWFFDLRVVKMARFIKLNLANNESAGVEFQKKNVILRYLKPERSINSRHDLYMQDIKNLQNVKMPNEYNPIEQAWYLFNSGNSKAAIEWIERAGEEKQIRPEEVAFNLIYFYYKSDNISKAEELLVDNFQKYPKSESVYNCTVYYYYEFANWYKKKLRYDAAIDYYLQAIALEPDADYFFTELNKIYDLQSHYDSQMIYQKLQAMLDKNPLLSISKNFTVNLNLYKDKFKWESGIEQWIYDDLSDIAKICQKKHIRLFIQKYPTDYVMVNRVLDKIAGEYRLPVIDHQAVFKPLEPKSKYFFDDDHCTNEGHKIMAKTIYDALAQENIIRM